MEFEVKPLDNQTALVALTGRLDTVGVDQIEIKFNAAVVAPGHHALVDLSQVSFMSSMGMRMLITAARSLQGRHRKLVLFSAQPLVAELLDTTAIDQIIPVASDLTAAVSVLKA